MIDSMDLRQEQEDRMDFGDWWLLLERPDEDYDEYLTQLFSPQSE